MANEPFPSQLFASKPLTTITTAIEEVQLLKCTVWIRRPVYWCPGFTKINLHFCTSIGEPIAPQLNLTRFSIISCLKKTLLGQNCIAN